MLQEPSLLQLHYLDSSCTAQVKLPHAVAAQMTRAAGSAAAVERQRFAKAVAECGRTRRVVASFLQNFGKMLLVFGCIGTDFCKKICVLQDFSKATRFSS